MASASSPSWEFIEPPPLATVFPAPRAAAARALSASELALLPRRRLRLAEFLFHCGRVSWKECCAAIQWQRAQRPSVGQLAIELGWLDRAQVARILRERVQDKAYQTPFCEYAMQKGYLSATQIAALLGRQRRRQRRIGEYFVERGLVGQQELDLLARALRDHNARQRGAR